MSSNATAGKVVLVNTVTQGSQDSSSLTTLSDGGWIVSWEGSGTDDSDGIYQRRYDKNGTALGLATLVNSAVTDDQFDTSVAALKDGGWLVSWSAQDNSLNNDVYQQRYDRNGKVTLSEVIVNGYATGSQSDSTVMALSDGGWLLTWAGEGPGDSSGIFQRRYDKNGASDGEDILVNTSYTTGNQYGPAVTMLKGGGWVTAWYGEGAGDPNGIFMQQFSKKGVAVGDATLVNTYTDFSQYSPSVTGLGDGGWVVAWYGYGASDTSSTGVYFRHYDSKGHVVGKVDTLVNTVTDATQSSPSVTVLADGGWLVTWQSPDKNQQSIYDIYQQRYDEDGHKIGTQTLVNDQTKADQRLPEVTAFADGSWLVAWQGAGKGDPDGIYQRHFAADIIGTSKADKLNGTGWGELLVGGKGADILSGGGGADTFSFKNGDGADKIKGFVAKGNDHDMIDLSAAKGISDYADLKAHHMEHTASSVTIEYSAHDSVTLLGVTIKMLSEADFVL